MFKRKKEDEWIITDDEYFDEPNSAIQSDIAPSKKEKPIKKKGKKIEEDEYDDFFATQYSYDDYDSENFRENSSKNRRPNPLRKRETDVYYYDSYGDDIIEMESPRKRQKWKIILPTVLVFILGLGVLGYVNTDFDNKGNPYIIPLEIRYERKYIKEADNLLNVLLTINESIDMDTYQLPTNYISMSAKLTEEMSVLKSTTTEFSKYVGVPKTFNAYHSQLINFSLSTQQLIDKLVKNYNDTDYESFRQAALTDYYNSLGRLKDARIDIDNIIFRNMEANNNGSLY